MAGCASVRRTRFIITGIHSKSVRRECALRWPQSLDSNFVITLSAADHMAGRALLLTTLSIKRFFMAIDLTSRPPLPAAPTTGIKTNEVVVNWDLIKFQADSAAILKRAH